jgi:hypothetical protein
MRGLEVELTEGLAGAEGRAAKPSWRASTRFLAIAGTATK